MKKFNLNTMLLAISVLLVITSCKKTEVDPVAPKSSSTDGSLSTLKSAAQVYHYRYTIDLSAPGWSEYNGCSGGGVKVLKGIWHQNFQFTFNGNRGTFIDNSNTSDYKLIDLTTGVQYTGSYISTFSEAWNIIDGSSGEWTGTMKILLTTPGPNNNGELLVDYHATITPNGEMTIYFYNQRVGCQ